MSWLSFKFYIFANVFATLPKFLIDNTGLAFLDIGDGSGGVLLVS